MSFNRHITRNFNANKTNRIRYDDDDFTCEILKFDKTYERQYTTDSSILTLENGEKDNFKGYSCFRSKDENDMVITFKYNAKESSDNYRLELLFANIRRKTKDSPIDNNLMCNAKIKVNGEEVKNSMQWLGTDVNFSRNYQYCSLKKGANYIEYSLSSNTIWLGLCIKKFDVWSAHRHNRKNDKLTMIKATVEHTEEFQINTMTAEFMYHHQLDELLDPTDMNANRSGLVFDFRDEITLSVKDTDGNDSIVFGGYISTAEVDDDLTKMTLECADRLIDLDRRYCLSEINMKGYSADDNMEYKGSADYLRNYNNYSDSLKFLMNSCEIFPKTNIVIGNPLVKRNTQKLATYRKGAYTKITPQNMKISVNDGSITLRNGADTLKGQSCVIYDSDTANQSVLLNEYPNLYFHYGLGVEKWEEKIVDTTTVTINGSTKASQTWIDRANKVTSAIGNDAIKPIWVYVSHFSQDGRSNFFQSSSKTWSSKNGNCCCKTECMLDLLNAKGVTNLQYVHCKRSDGRGHIFAKVNGFYVDPSTSIESRGWHNYIKGYGSIVNVTDYPNKPF